MNKFVTSLKELITEKRFSAKKFEKTKIDKFNPRTLITKTKIDKIF